MFQHNSFYSWSSIKLFNNINARLTSGLAFCGEDKTHDLLRYSDSCRYL